jgi:hypothetical protein
LRKTVHTHDEWLRQLTPTYGGWTIEPAPTIVVTETPFERPFYGFSGEDIAIISVANWQRYLAPPTVVEFVLSRVQRYALRLAFVPNLGSHYPTRACVWDFDANLEDTRAGILVGYLCSYCEAELSKVIDGKDLEQVRHLLSHDWLGRPDEPGSIAGNLKRMYGYDLARTKGLSHGLRDVLVEAIASEGGKWLILFLLGAIAAWLFGKRG